MCVIFNDLSRTFYRKHFINSQIYIIEVSWNLQTLSSKKKNNIRFCQINCVNVFQHLMQKTQTCELSKWKITNVNLSSSHFVPKLLMFALIISSISSEHTTEWLTREVHSPYRQVLSILLRAAGMIAREMRSRVQKSRTEPKWNRAKNAYLCPEWKIYVMHTRAHGARHMPQRPATHAAHSTLARAGVMRSSYATITYVYLVSRYAKRHGERRDRDGDDNSLYSHARRICVRNRRDQQTVTMESVVVFDGEA